MGGPAESFCYYTGYNEHSSAARADAFTSYIRHISQRGNSEGDNNCARVIQPFSQEGFPTEASEEGGDPTVQFAA